MIYVPYLLPAGGKEPKLARSPLLTRIRVYRVYCKYRRGYIEDYYVIEQCTKVCCKRYDPIALNWRQINMQDLSLAVPGAASYCRAEGVVTLSSSRSVFFAYYLKCLWDCKVRQFRVWPVKYQGYYCLSWCPVDYDGPGAHGRKLCSALSVKPGKIIFMLIK